MKIKSLIITIVIEIAIIYIMLAGTINRTINALTSDYLNDAVSTWQGIQYEFTTAIPYLIITIIICFIIYKIAAIAEDKGYL